MSEFLIEIIKEIIKGCFIAFGVFFGFSFFLYKFLNKKSEKKKPRHLLSAFKQYRQRLVESDRFESVDEIDKIIFTLSNGDLHPDVEKFHIDTETVFEVNEHNEGSKIKIVTTYNVVGKKKIF